ncbi:AAA family ATPase [Myxococcota bacterium]|nr:AAA family ATPase [Myxococcota bacterium]MBU1897764.1 AAA family ATPase [Myxococcota bacterium]
MLQQLDLKNFTVFPEATFSFGAQLNIIHGENGAGKSHLLKLAYVLEHALASPPSTAQGSAPTKAGLQRAVAEELVEVFRPDALGRLVTRTPPGRKGAQVQALFAGQAQPLSFAFHSASKTEVKIAQAPSAWLDAPPVFLPTREALTIYPGFVSLYDTTVIEFDRTWRDLCLLLGAPLSRGPRAARGAQLLAPLEQAMGGRVELDQSGRFYLNDDRGRVEINLVAEGLRKLAMIARLIATGHLVGQGALFWDEPEANLNPKLINAVAAVLVALASQGVQVIVATHSLFLVRALYLLVSRAQSAVSARYFGLHLRQEGGGAEVYQGDEIGAAGAFVALDEDLAQAERYLDHETGLG